MELEYQSQVALIVSYCNRLLTCLHVFTLNTSNLHPEWLFFKKQNEEVVSCTYSFLPQIPFKISIKFKVRTRVLNVTFMVHLPPNFARISSACWLLHSNTYTCIHTHTHTHTHTGTSFSFCIHQVKLHFLTPLPPLPTWSGPSAPCLPSIALGSDCNQAYSFMTIWWRVSPLTTSGPKESRCHVCVCLLPHS